jgi:hypothetical protein
MKTAGNSPASWAAPSRKLVASNEAPIKSLDQLCHLLLLVLVALVLGLVLKQEQQQVVKEEHLLVRSLVVCLAR